MSEIFCGSEGERVFEIETSVELIEWSNFFFGDTLKNDWEIRLFGHRFGWVGRYQVLHEAG